MECYEYEQALHEKNLETTRKTTRQTPYLDTFYEVKYFSVYQERLRGLKRLL